MIEKKVASSRKQGIWRVKKGFKLVEMLVVLLVISILVLLFVPNLAKQRGIIDEKGNAAIVKVVETQIELFRLNENREPSREELIAEGYVSEEQYAIYEQGD
ncbi:competence type IV pilus major pilin ComGC [Enterococcus sp. DIV1297f]|uniref:competence type IV pilus major pilin ComGC n=1 Tax=Enterococcus sp. DIV1297f TaxID=2774691 RepID=UPI003D2DB5CE